MNREQLWKEELAMLRTIIIKSGLETSVKWGAEVFTFQNKNVVSCGGFKNHFCLWFYNGVFLSDPYKVLINAQEGKTKALRQWRFTSKTEIDETKILEYVHEAIMNEEKGKVWKPQKSELLPVPELLQAALNDNKKLYTAFNNLTPYKQKEYIEYLITAKQEATRLNRLEKIKPMILVGKGLNDKYRK